MSDQGGPSYDSFRVNSMLQANQGGGGGADKRFFKDLDTGAGLSSKGKGLNSDGKIFGGAGISSVVGQKGPRSLGKLTSAMGISYNARFDGEIKPMTDGIQDPNQGGGGMGGEGKMGDAKTEDVMGKAPMGLDGQPINHSQGVGLDVAGNIKEAEKVFGSRFAHKALHNEMPMPTEFIAPTRLNPMEMARLFGEAASGSTGGASSGGGGTYSEVYGSGQVIIQNGGQLRGSLPESMLTGAGAIQAPATPSVGRGRERDSGMGM